MSLKFTQDCLANNLNTDVTVKENGEKIEIRINTKGLNANSSAFCKMAFRQNLLKSFYEGDILVMICKK